MAPRFPSEVWRLILEYVQCRRTLFALLLTCQYIHPIAEIVLYNDVQIYPFHILQAGRLDIPLQALRRSVSAHDGRRCTLVKHLSIFVGSALMEAKACDCLDDILHTVKNLQSFELIEYPGWPAPISLRAFTNPQALTFSLKRFNWGHTYISWDSAWSSFLLSQKTIEHLEFPVIDWLVPELDAAVLPRLRILQASLESVLQILPGRNVKCLKTAFRDNVSSRGFRIVERGSISLQVLSATYAHIQTFLSFLSRLQELRCLEVYSGDIVMAAIGDLRRTNTQCIRFQLIHLNIIPHLFEEIPSLQCIDVERGPFLPWNDGRIYDRWYREAERAVGVQWTCSPGEQWFHDWNKDVRVL